MICWKRINVGDHELIATKVLRIVKGWALHRDAGFWNELNVPTILRQVPELEAGFAAHGVKIEAAILLALSLPVSCNRTSFFARFQNTRESLFR